MTTAAEYSIDSVAMIEYAIKSLAGVCDGAIKQDGIGYNGTDTKFGHRMAAIESGEWSVDMLITSAMVLRKYANQLSMYGIDIMPAINDIVHNAGDFDESSVSKRGHTEAWQREYARKHAPYITEEYGIIKVHNSYEIRRELSDNGFAFCGSTKTWDGPLNSITASTLLNNPSINLTDQQRRILTGPCVIQVIPDTEEVKKESFNITVKPDNSGTLILETEWNTIPLTVTRSIPGRQWDGYAKVNYISALPTVFDLAEKYGLTISDDARALIESKRAAVEEEQAKASQFVAASLAEDTDRNDMALAKALRPYQRAGVVYSLDENRPHAFHTLLADEMGLGKTWQAISALETANAFPALIICPSSLVLNWEREIRALIPHRTTEIYTFRMVGDAFKIGDADITIMPYGVVDSYLDALPLLKGFVADESHYIKNEKAKRTAAILQICGRGTAKDGTHIPASLTDDALVLCMTGTPILNRPLELVQPLRALGILTDHPSASIIGSVAWFKYQFCKPELGYKGRVSFTGSSNEEQLHMWLRASCMIRRLKKDVLKDLPRKIRSPRFIELNKPSRALYERLAQEGAEKAAESRAEALVYLNALRQAVGNAKIEMALEWISEFLETEKQLIVFAKHKRVQHEIINSLREKGINVTHILGGQDKNLIEEHKAEFQAGRSQVIVLSLDAAREGHTLTAASDVLFIEQGWNPGTHNQAEDRCHRIGQTDSVTAWYLVGLDTIDEWLFELIEAKRVVCDAVNDGAVPDDSEESIITEVLDRAIGRYGVKRKF